MGKDKTHHYVPQCYLESWATEHYLYTIPKNKGLTRHQHKKEVAKKNHLYKLPSTLFKNSSVTDPDLKELIVEKLIFKIWEDRWAKVRYVLDHHIDLTQVLHSIKGFVITQSFRTPKFQRLNKEKLERMGKADDDIEDAFHFAFLGIKGLTDYIENCVCEIFKIVDLPNFVTCDNPATHWIREGDIFHHLNGIALNEDLYKNPNYKILCPIHPKYFAMLSPNLGINVSEKDKNKVWFTSFDKDTINQLNQMVEHGADKMLFAKDLKDFIKL